MSSAALYTACVLIWGSTWFAITFQLGVVPPAVSVVYRFGLASLILLAWCAARGLTLRFTRNQHGSMALQGFLLFGATYVLVYLSEGYISSGLTAVLFSSIVFLNLVFMRVFQKAPIRRAALGGAILGILGVAAVFAPEFSALEASSRSVRGIGYGLLATVSASLGNVVAARNHRLGLPVVQQNAFGMLYGSILVAAYVMARGDRFVLPPSLPYLASLAYLSLFGSVLAFSAYLTLLGRIGPAKAGYTSVVIPIVALVISAVFEGFHWTAATGLGVLLCGLGNVLVLGIGRRSPVALATAA